jgi:hypothetical protein
MLAHWPGLPAGVRRDIHDVDAREPCALVEVAGPLAETVDLEDARELVGVDHYIA